MPSLEAEDIIFATRRLGVSFIPATRQTTTCRQHVVEDHLRPAAVKARALSSHRDLQGQLVDDDPRRFGFHNLRHSLASFLIRIRTDPKTVQTLLRHSDVKLTLQVYTHAVSRDRMTRSIPRAFNAISPTLTTNVWRTSFIRHDIFSIRSSQSSRPAVASGPLTAGIASRPCAALTLNPSRH
jgi:hypothetical protein